MQTYTVRKAYNRLLREAQIELDTIAPTSGTPIEVNYVHMQPGQIMTDTGCKASVAGLEWHRELTELLESFGLGEYIVEIPQKEAFKFGDGESVISKARHVYPVGIRRKIYMLSVSVVPNNCPGLMSYEQLEQLEGVISLKDRKVELLGERGALDMSTSGHPLIKLTEYPALIGPIEPLTMAATYVAITDDRESSCVSDPEEYESVDESTDQEDGNNSEVSDETVTTDHSGYVSDTVTESESEPEYTSMYEHDVHSTMPTKYMSKSQRRKVRRNLFEISESYKTDESEVHFAVPRQIEYKPKPRQPGRWRMIEIFTWTAMVAIVAGTMPQWQAFEPLTLPRWDLLDWKAQDDALRLLEEHDIDFSIIAWPCTPWSIMQNLNQKPHQIRALVQQQAEHR